MKMNYQNIAELVHDLVKNPKSMLSSEHRLFPEFKPDEFKIIQNVFSKYDVSGDAATLRISPLGIWA